MQQQKPWLSGLAGVALLLVCLGAPCRALAAVCLPPMVDGGRRLHANDEQIRVLWLPLTLRQHEICWRQPKREGELRVLVAGNSGVFGIQLPAERTLAAELNRRFQGDAPGAHFFNVGHAYAYQLKDALILREALRFDPDFIVYAVTLNDFHHRVALTSGALRDFFQRNRNALADFAAEEPEGLVEAVAKRREQLDPESLPQLASLRQLGLFVRDGVRYQAEQLRAHWFGRRPAPLPRYDGSEPYDCEDLLGRFHRTYWRWKDWNILAYLAQIRRETGVGVMVVSWPIAHDPIGACYNVRYPGYAVANYNKWIREEVRRLDLPFVDLHDFLPRHEIFDSMHLTAAGHRRIAERIEPLLREQLEQQAQRAATAR